MGDLSITLSEQVVKAKSVLFWGNTDHHGDTKGSFIIIFFLPESNNIWQEMRSINRADLVCVSGTKAI